MWLRAARADDLEGPLALAVAGLAPGTSRVWITEQEPARVAILTGGELGRAAADLQALGFDEVARFVDRAVDLRPITRWAAARGLPPLAHALAGSADLGLARARRASPLRPRPARHESVVELSLPEDAEGVALVLERAWSGSIAPRVEPLDSSDRSWLGLTRVGQIVAVLAHDTTPTTPGHAGARVSILAACDEDEAALAKLLEAAERRARAAGVETLSVLDSLGPAAARVALGRGYVEAGQPWTLFVSPGEPGPEADPCLDTRRWRVPGP